MVLQQNADAEIWGWGNPDEKVSVTASWDGRTYEARFSDGGGCGSLWTVTLPTAEAGGPYEITVATGSDTLKVSDVLLGEVWICSGQSNMAMPVRGYTFQPVEGAMQTVLEAPEYSGKIHIFNVERDSSHVYRDDVTGKWQDASSKSVSYTSAVAYGFATRLTDALGVPVGIIVSAFGGTKIEAWTPEDALKASLEGVIPDADIEKKLAVRNTGRKKPDQAGTLFNAMIHPLAPYTAKGFLWYQGCSNRKDYTHYAEMQTAMAASWREAWQDKDADMLFAFVTIAPHSYGDSMDDTRAFFVENQLESLGTIPHSLATVTEDCGEEDCIHPSRKTVVADRLVWNVLVSEYGFSGLPAGYPQPTEYEIGDGKITVFFENAKYGLCPSYGEPVKGFMIAGSDRRFHEAEAVILRGPCRVEVSSPEVKEPVAVRYAFRNYMESNLRDTAGNPVPPFRSDDWKR